MPSKRRTKLAAAALLLLAASLGALCSSCSSPGTESPPAPKLPADVESAAKAAFGADGVALDFGDFSAAGGRQVLVVHRLSSPPQPVAAAPQKPETYVDVIRVSLLSRDGANWKEAFRADGHLKNRRGYLDASLVPISSWRMTFTKTADSGFQLEFSALNLPPGSKPVNVRIAWNPKKQEYDALDATGTRFLEPLATPGGAIVKVDR